MAGDKKTIRQDMLARRLALPEAERSAAGAAMCGHLARHFLKSWAEQGRTVAGYGSVKGEIDPFAFLREAQARGVALALPFIGADDAMSFRAWTLGSVTQTGVFGIPTASGGASVLPDVILLPLVAYDPRGYRLGYGGAYYDRTLARPEYAGARRIGLAYGWQRVPALPGEAHDARMHAVVTENGLEFFL